MRRLKNGGCSYPYDPKVGGRPPKELLGLSGSVEFLLGQPEDVLPQLLGSHGRNAVEVSWGSGGVEVGVGAGVEVGVLNSSFGSDFGKSGSCLFGFTERDDLDVLYVFDNVGCREQK